jgi:serine/threonine protein kinase/lipoprotein NlpI
MIGRIISHYKILDKIGEGGMSVVYKAQDTTLGRFVALKIPSKQILEDKGKKARFLREARAVAALDHPNICTLHEIGQAEGKTFISMTYIDGQSLRERIKAGPLNLDEAVDIAIQTAQGLFEAHEKGIVHRDIKSVNIMITGSGQVKIMDFGIAKLASETTETRLTRQGAIMGTVDYMSPEQARGNPVDYRTDIWSLGVVMYEMLTGRLPFKADNEPAIVHAILYEEPEKLRNLRREIPPPLEQTVLISMQKEPVSRHENLGVLISRLRAIRRDYLTSSTPYKKSPSIAVLPFTDMSPEKDQEYFGDGMAEELINALTHIKDLHVIARTSAFSYKGKDVKIRDIGRELDVKTVLEGSVRKAGNRLRITAQLIETTSGHHLWSDRYDRDMDDVFAIQDEITAAIVDKLRPKLLGQEKVRLANRQTVDLQAYNLYLQGFYFRGKRTEMGLKKAIHFFEQAIQRDPDYALAYAGLAVSYSYLPLYSPLPPKETVNKARHAALRALEIDAMLPEAHTSLGHIKTVHDWDWEGGESQYKRAIELNPGCANAHHLYSFNLLYRARFDEAIKEVKKALELDPVSVATNRQLGFIYYYARQFDRAIDAMKKTIEMDPSILYAHLQLGQVYLAKSMYEEALIEFQQEREVSRGSHAWIEECIGAAYVKMGKQDEAQKVLDNLLARSKQEYIPPYILASLHLELAKNDEGFKLLNKAYEECDPWLCYFKISLTSDSVRSDPRYIELLKKMNLE